MALGGDGEATGNWVAWRGRHDRSAQAAPAVPGARPQWSFPTFQRELDDPKRQERLGEVLGELGCNGDRIAALREKGAVV